MGNLSSLFSTPISANNTKIVVGLDEILEYEIKVPVGVALLFGCEGSPGHTKLESVRKDLQLMHSSLHDCGFEVMNPCLQSSGIELSYAMVMNTFAMLATDPQLQQYHCFFFYFTGHGVSNSIVFKDGTLPFSAIIEKIGELKALTNRPKIFVFDCCRVHKQQSKFQVIKSAISKPPQEEPGLPPDCLICYAATNQKKAMGNKDDGGYYTRHFASILRTKHETMSVTDIVDQVHARMRREFRNYDDPPQAEKQNTLNARLILNGMLLGMYIHCSI